MNLPPNRQKGRRLDTRRAGLDKKPAPFPTFAKTLEKLEQFFFSSTFTLLKFNALQLKYPLLYRDRTSQGYGFRSWIRTETEFRIIQ